MEDGVTEESKVRPYEAIVWTPEPNRPGERVAILASSGDEAVEKLKTMFGTDITYTIYNAEDAVRPR